MEIEDTSEKLRRNVVVFNCALIVIAYLDIKFSGQLALLNMKADIHSSPLRVWICVIVSQLYLTARYLHDGVGKFHWEEAKNEWLRHVIRRIASLIAKQANISLQANSIVVPHVGEFHFPGSNGRDFTDMSCSLETGVIYSAINNPNQHLWAFRAEVNMRQGDNKNVADRFNLFFDFSCSKKIKRWVIFRSFLDLLPTSQAMVQFAIPIFLACIGCGVCLFNIGKSLISG